MTKFAHRLGLQTLFEFVDVLAFDIETMATITPEIYECQALIFLYPLTHKFPSAKPERSSQSVYLMKQTVENACGSIALIHSLANNLETVNPSSFIFEYQSKTKNMSAEERGNTLESDEAFAQLHASFSAQGQTAAPEASANIDLHFVAFVRGKDGFLYELDGRQEGAIKHGLVGSEQGAFFKVCCDTIQGKYLNSAPDAQVTALALVPEPAYVA